MSSFFFFFSLYVWLGFHNSESYVEFKRGTTEFLLKFYIYIYVVTGIVSEWGVYVSICLEILGISDIFVLILFYFPYVEFDFQESR